MEGLGLSHFHEDAVLLLPAGLLITFFDTDERSVFFFFCLGGIPQMVERGTCSRSEPASERGGNHAPLRRPIAAPDRDPLGTPRRRR